MVRMLVSASILSIGLAWFGWSTHQARARIACVYGAESVREFDDCSMPGYLERHAQVIFGPLTGM